MSCFPTGHRVAILESITWCSSGAARPPHIDVRAIALLSPRSCSVLLVCCLQMGPGEGTLPYSLVDSGLAGMMRADRDEASAWERSSDGGAKDAGPPTVWQRVHLLARHVVKDPVRTLALTTKGFDEKDATVGP